MVHCVCTHVYILGFEDQHADYVVRNLKPPEGKLPLVCDCYEGVPYYFPSMTRMDKMYVHVSKLVLYCRVASGMQV